MELAPCGLPRHRVHQGSLETGGKSAHVVYQPVQSKSTTQRHGIDNALRTFHICIWTPTTEPAPFVLSVGEATQRAAVVHTVVVPEVRDLRFAVEFARFHRLDGAEWTRYCAVLEHTTEAAVLICSIGVTTKFTRRATLIPIIRFWRRGVELAPVVWARHLRIRTHTTESALGVHTVCQATECRTVDRARWIPKVRGHGIVHETAGSPNQ